MNSISNSSYKSSNRMSTENKSQNVNKASNDDKET